MTQQYKHQRYLNLIKKTDIDQTKDTQASQLASVALGFNTCRCKECHPEGRDSQLKFPTKCELVYCKRLFNTRQYNSDHMMCEDVEQQCSIRIKTNDYHLYLSKSVLLKDLLFKPREGHNQILHIAILFIPSSAAEKTK